MTEYPPITIVMTTYFPSGDDGDKRLATAALTVKSWVREMHYLSAIRLHVADDGSDDYYDNFVWSFDDIPATYSKQNRRGVGASLNAGFRQAFKLSPIVLYCVDDWLLMEPLVLTPWVKLLLEREDVGMVRLGPPHPKISGTVETFTEDWQGWGLRLNRLGYAFGHRPALYHKRMIDSYGWFAEDCDAMVCEKKYNAGFCQSSGPDIVLALPHPWQHLESVELGFIDPTNG